MENSKRIRHFIENEINLTDVKKLFNEVEENDVINKSVLFLYVEATYYKQILDDSQYMDIMKSFYEMVSNDDLKLTKLNLLYIIYKTEMINKKSSSNLYI